MHNLGDNVTVRIASRARRHLLTRSRIPQALEAHTEAVTLIGNGGDPTIMFIGRDGRGIELEILAIGLPRELLVIHALLTHYRRGRP